MKLTKIVVGKGKTNQVPGKDEWTRQYFEIEVLVEDPSELDLAKGFAEGTVDGWLNPTEKKAVEAPKPAPVEKMGIVDASGLKPKETAIPDLNANELLNHEWRGKKIGYREYEKGKLDWGWDFREQFSDAAIKVLEKGPLVVDAYEFTLTEKLVQSKKKK